MARSAANHKGKCRGEEPVKDGVPANGRWCDCVLDAVRCRPELVQLLVAAHDYVERLATEHDAVLEGVELGRRRYQGWILAFHPELLLDANVLAPELECAVSFVVSGRSSAAQSYGEAVADAEASEGLLFCVLWFEGADFEDKGSIEDEEVEGYRGWQWRVEGLLVDRMLPPRWLHVRVALECLPRFLDMVVQQLELASDKVGFGRISSPDGHIDDVQAAVDGGSDRGELGDDQRRCLGGRGDGQVVRG
jgi:hypothetical protein